MAGRVAQQVITCSDDQDVPHRADAVPKVRRQLRSKLLLAGVSRAVRDDAELVAAEFLANAIRHARGINGAVRLSVTVDPRAVEIRLTDGGASQDPPGHPPQESEPHSPGGRGLSIVDQLCTDWGTLEHADGRHTVWARLAITPPDGGPAPANQPGSWQDSH